MDTEGAGRDLSRRQVLSTAGLAAVAVPLAARYAPALVRQADKAGAPGPEQVHVQFGADASSQVAVSWATPTSVTTRSRRGPRSSITTPDPPRTGRGCRPRATTSPQGYLSYQTRFELPDNGSDEFRGNWYAFTVGPIRVISLNNDDVCLQDGGFSAYRRDHVPTYVSNGDNPYIVGYSSGAQKQWLERELASAQRSDEIDWIIVCMHQVAMSSAHFNGAGSPRSTSCRPSPAERRRSR